MGCFLYWKRAGSAQCAPMQQRAALTEIYKMFTQANLMKLGITAAVLFGAYRFAPNAAVKAMVLGVAGVVVAKNTPVLNTYIAI